ncbi:glutathione-disulfide reductase [Polymorphobacter fuscus]|uniref:Glutathione-disulfide reductase n=1 Tax=Sandarakinorhabdus fusca TaxID=1439888 RepID=A0A7C9KH16_9SPHN|nr:glutathione-disulfide reductase [Polymorphobacter fuscus]KAB7648491.1 glutathione-disulfide reductase [Polymorphobacter fuscus]MQT16019.1 glutathione-disulfide reductase [Polymorphobacter fuscus]NJC07704.1 glutathione reductase (NADPH) [Polymorphobacter fuscus]
MTSFDHDLFVIGAGSGGVRASRIASGHGANVAVAEEFRVGGTCVIRGCVPKKLLVYGAHFAEDLVDAKRFGWQIEGKAFDWPTLRDNVLGEVDRLNGLYQNTLDSHQVTTLHGRATFIDAHTVAVDGKRITAKHILVATGARPFVPDIPGAELGITSNEVFHLPTLPRRVVIAGGGYIANEFAGIFHELGSDVTLINRSESILRGWEPALADRLLTISVAKGINFKLSCGLERLEKTADGIRVHFTDGKSVDTDVFLWAVGRRPNVEGLGLEAAGVALSETGAIQVDADSQTSVPHIYAVGDVTDRIQLTPIAIREGHAVADRLFGTRDWRVDYSVVPSAVFSNPPLGSVGMTEAQAKNAYGTVKIFTSDFRPMRNVLANRNERALYKLVVAAASDKVVGAHMIGPDSPEILQAVAIAIKAGLTKAQFDDTVALHPTMSEELVLMK